MARLLLFGGKGGVGKTTTSTATAIHLADCGLRVLLVSSDPAHSTSDSLGVDIGTEPTPVQGVEGLYGLEMDPESKLSNLLPKLGNMVDGMNSGGGLGGLGGLGMMLDPSAKQELDEIKSDVKTSDMILPGLDEALAFDELLKHVEDPNWDVIVFDTAPTGHTLRFLSLPEIIESWSGRLIRLMRVSGGIRSMLFGRKESEEMKQELERFRNRVLHVRRVLSDSQLTSFTLVTIPEKMGVNETVRAYNSLIDYQLPVSACIVNRVTPKFDHPFLQNRREAEQNRITELKDRLTSV
ncbi:MAG: ArsA family ATPase, partial [Candidatus Poseidoniaceae archaeon]